MMPSVSAALTGGTSGTGYSGSFEKGGMTVTKGIAGLQILLGVVAVAGSFVAVKIFNPEKRKGK